MQLNSDDGHGSISEELNALFLKRTREIEHIGSFILDLTEGTSGSEKWYCTETLFRILGIDPHLPRTSHDAWKNLIVQKKDVESAYADAIRSRTKRINIDYTIRRADGTCRDIHSISDIEYDSDGKPKRMIGTLQDITEQKQFKDELTYKNALLSTQQETSIDGILVVSEDGSILYFNSNFQAIWEIPDKLLVSGRDEIVLKHVTEKLSDPEEFLSKVQYLYSHHDEKDRVELKLQDGRVLDRYSAPVKDRRGVYYGRIWYFRDITEKKMAEERYKTIIQTSMDGFALTDMAGKILDVNDAFCEMTDRTRNELLSMLIGDIAHTDAEEDDETILKQILEKGSKKFEATHTRNDGNTIDLEIGVQLLKESDTLIYFIRDISEKKKAEAEKAKLQEQLIQAQKMESVGRLAGGIAHDFNNLLTAIVGNAELGMMNTRPGDPVYSLLSSIKQA
ncbi:MAG: PAS domain S-box protein, partial [Spirochaetota bacterium]